MRVGERPPRAKGSWSEGHAWSSGVQPQKQGFAGEGHVARNTFQEIEIFCIIDLYSTMIYIV